MGGGGRPPAGQARGQARLPRQPGGRAAWGAEQQGQSNRGPDLQRAGAGRPVVLGPADTIGQDGDMTVYSYGSASPLLNIDWSVTGAGSARSGSTY